MRNSTLAISSPVSGSVFDAKPVENSKTYDHVLILDFERQWSRHRSAKEQAIRATFGISTARYYQMLTSILDTPGAVAYDPVLVNRLNRIAQERADARAERFAFA